MDRQTDGRTDRWTDDVKPGFPPFNFVEAVGLMIEMYFIETGYAATND